MSLKAISDHCTVYAWVRHRTLEEYGTAVSTHLRCKYVTHQCAPQPASNYLAAYFHYFSPAVTRLLVVCY